MILNIKRCLLVLVFFHVGLLSFAEVVRQQSGNGVTVDWSFAPEVSTHVGLNIDQVFFGMEGAAELTAKTTIRKESDEDFVSNGDQFYAQVQVKDLEITFNTEDQNQGREDRSASATPYSYGDGSDDASGAPLLIKWGDIKGTVFLGPVYLELVSKEHDKIDYVKNLNDDSGHLVNVEYDIIPPAYTGRRANVGFISPKDPGASLVDVKPEDSSISNTLVAATNNLASAVLGYKLDSIMDLRFGMSTQYSYKDLLNNEYNGMAFSIDFTLLAVENLLLETKFSMITGVGNRDVLEESNPMSWGVLATYSLPIGTQFILKPAVSLDFSLEKKFEGPLYTVVDGDLTTVNYTINENQVSFATSEETRTVGHQWRESRFTVPVEMGVGLNFLWSKQGVVNVDKDRFEGGDHNVSDGASLGVLYGNQPHSIFREATLNYIGVKLALWDSEDSAGEKYGIIPGLEALVVANFNYALGEEVKFDKGFSDEDNVATATLEPQFDVGLGIDLAYEISFVKPKLGLIYKGFNLLGAKYGGTITEEGEDNLYITRNDNNAHDLRIKLGLDVIKLVPNTTFEVLWETGDLIREGEYNKNDYYSANSFFDNEGSNQERNIQSGAFLGYIKLGTVISF